MSNLFSYPHPYRLPEGKRVFELLEAPINRIAYWISAKTSGNKCSSGRCQSKRLLYDRMNGESLKA